MNHGYQPVGLPIDLSKVHPPRTPLPMSSRAHPRTVLAEIVRRLESLRESIRETRRVLRRRGYYGLHR